MVTYEYLSVFAGGLLRVIFIYLYLAGKRGGCRSEKLLYVENKGWNSLS